MDSYVATSLGWAFGFGFGAYASTAGEQGYKLETAFVGSFSPNSWNTFGTCNVLVAVTSPL